MKINPVLLFISSICSVIVLVYLFMSSKNVPDINNKKYYSSYDTIYHTLITSYQAVSSQTNSKYWEAASMITITDDMYFTNQEYGYCAVSRDLLNFYLNFFDTVYVKMNKGYQGFIVIDVMNKRFTNSIDILSSKSYKFHTNFYYRIKN